MGEPTFDRRLNPKFFADLNDESNNLNFILDYERSNKGFFIVELRKNFLDLYVLGHGIEVSRAREDKSYYLKGSYQFNPKDSLKSDDPEQLDKLKQLAECYGPLIKGHVPSRWKICIDRIDSQDDFRIIMDGIITRIAAHKRGNISEGVSEINHLADNRDARKNGILVIDHQVGIPKTGKKLDLLGVRRLEKSGKYAFVVIELKNKGNSEIGTVFSQLKDYINIIKKNYVVFVKTYTKIIRQKRELKLLDEGIKIEFAEKNEITKKDILGIAILDNFDIRSELKPNGLLNRALKNWKENSKKGYCLSLFLKTNVLDNTFFLDYPAAVAIRKRYIARNAVSD